MGSVVLSVIVSSPRTVNVSFTQPAETNGLMVYNVFFEGTFYTNAGE